MNRRLIIFATFGLAILVATASVAFAQHGGHGGHGGGHGYGHGGHSYGHGYGGHGYSHSYSHGYGGHGYGHSYGYGYGGHGYGGHGYGGHGYGGHGYGHSYGHGYGGHGYGHSYGHHYYPHVDFYVSPYASYGYSSYSSPYYYGYAGGGRALNYAAPATVAPATVAQTQPNPSPRVAAKPATTSDGLAYQKQAEEAFRAGTFERAARLANHALVEMPRDGKLLLFAAQTLFAVDDYRSAAAAIHHATSLLDTDQWGYVVENYRQYYRGSAYVEQMEQLNQFIKETPDASYAHFLRGYQHGFLGHQKSALRDLNKAFDLENRDELASKLIVHFGGEAPAIANPQRAPGTAIKSDGHNHDHGDTTTPAVGGAFPTPPIPKELPVLEAPALSDQSI